MKNKLKKNDSSEIFHILFLLKLSILTKFAENTGVPFCAKECYKILCFAFSTIFKSLIINTIQMGSFPGQPKGHPEGSGFRYSPLRLSRLYSDVRSFLFSGVPFWSTLPDFLSGFLIDFIHC
jgi:hypothetical protein